MEAEKLYVDDFMTEDEVSSETQAKPKNKKLAKALQEKFSLKNLVSQFVLK